MLAHYSKVVAAKVEPRNMVGTPFCSSVSGIIME